MGLTLIVGFTFGQVIAFALGIWAIVEVERQDMTQTSLALKLLVAYDLGLTMCFIGAIIWTVLKSRQPLLVDPPSSTSSLDLEDK